MKFKNITQLRDFYYTRFAFTPPQIDSPPPPDTQLILAIPSYCEPKLLHTLESLIACETPKGSVEVLVIFNYGIQASPQDKAYQEQAAQAFQSWNRSQKAPHLRFYALWARDLPHKYAGVGLARKIAMDEALHRWASLNRDGGIVALDADCLVASHYLVELEKAFQRDVNSLSIYFEHQMDQTEALHQGILQYELYLRYYVQGLRFAGFPHAFHTVGSSMAVRASIYARSGGMNRRKAGEDFYFLHKVAPLGKHEDLISTTVYPSARISQRVPFGTGRAQQNFIARDNSPLQVYDPKSFEILKGFFEQVPSFFNMPEETLSANLETYPESLRSFLVQHNFLSQTLALRQKSRQPETFLKHFFQWMDGFKVLKWMHYVRDHDLPEWEVGEAAQALAKKIGTWTSPTSHVPDLLALYRRLDRGEAF